MHCTSFPVVAALGLASPEILSLPDPFAVIAVDSEQTHRTSVIKDTRDPYWNERFDVSVILSSDESCPLF
jgi:E3 ubiquitin-protein ligase NEDD4